MPLPQLMHPTFQIQIPSSSLLTTIRPMLVAEDKILLMAKESADPVDIYVAIRQVVANCLHTDIDKLTLFDLEYLFLKIRGISVSNILNASYEDQEDGKVYTFDIDIDKDIIMKYPEAISNTIEFENNGNKIRIIMKYPPANLYGNRDFLNQKGNFLETLAYHSVDKLMLNDGECVFSADEFRKWVEELPIEVFNKIKDYFEHLPHLYCSMEYTNENGKVRKIELSTLEDFFILR